MSLLDMYGQARGQYPVADIVEKHGHRQHMPSPTKESPTARDRGLKELVDTFKKFIREHTPWPKTGSRKAREKGVKVLVDACKKFLPNVCRYAQELDEEQEREMEVEIEREQEVEKVPRRSPAKEECPLYLKKLVETADYVQWLDKNKRRDCDASPVWHCLGKTSLRQEHVSLLRSQKWHVKSLLATKSYRRTVERMAVPSSAVRYPSYSTSSRHQQPPHSHSYYGDGDDDDDDDDDPLGRHALSLFNNMSMSNSAQRTHQISWKTPMRRVMDSFLRPVEWLLIVHDNPELVVVVVSPFEANQLLSVPRWSPRVSLHMYASPIHPKQSHMADWKTAIRGPRLGRIHTMPAAVRLLFAELLCFSGGLFFGPTADEQRATMRDLSVLLDLVPDPGKGNTEVPVRWHGGEHGLAENAFRSDPKMLLRVLRRLLRINDTFPRNPMMLIRALLRLLRTRDSVDGSHMGTLLRHSWLKLESEQLDEAMEADRDTVVGTMPRTVSNWAGGTTSNHKLIESFNFRTLVLCCASMICLVGAILCSYC